jgi:peptidoglycan/xylan/chitin deacetylase (PgdA/CDA1 family)
MYHYVRELERTRFPGIKGLKVSAFREQLAYIRRFYSVITAEELLDTIDRRGSLPANAALLTFDDGFADHFTNVFPILQEAGLQGTFFVPAEPVTHGRLLDVHKIHFILASVPDARLIVDVISKAITNRQSVETHLKSAAEYYSQCAQPGRFDSADVVFIKKMLQYALPEGLRRTTVAELFNKFVTADEEAFASELYLTADQIRCMVRMGMHFGSHGYAHPWIDHLDTSEQQLEIVRSLEFLRSMGVDTHRWIFSYPYGAWNSGLLELLKTTGCKAAFTTDVGIADLAKDPLLLPRLDTNHLPNTATAPPCEWTQAAISRFNRHSQQCPGEKVPAQKRKQPNSES